VFAVFHYSWLKDGKKVFFHQVLCRCRATQETEGKGAQQTACEERKAFILLARGVLNA
jgi:hypothetical protein